MSETMEIEVRFQVGDLSDLVAALAARAVVLSGPVHQDDQAYAQDGWRYGMSTRGVAFARLRTQAGRHLFALKRPADNELGYLEFEAEVADRGQMHEAILQMGFRPTVRVCKVRRAGRLGEMALRLDEVERLGAFLEIERIIVPGWSGGAVQAALDTFANSLRVPLQRTTDTYDSLLHAALAAV